MSKKYHVHTTQSMKEILDKSISLEEYIEKLTLEERKLVEQRTRFYLVQNAVRELRLKSGLTQELLAMKLEIPRTTITKIESGSRNVTIDTLMKIAVACDKELVISFK